MSSYIAGYVRVSTAKQDAEMQRTTIDRVARARDDGHVIFYEDKRGGDETKRPALETLRKEIREGQVRKLYVWRLDRLSRSVRHMLNLIEEFEGNGCKVETISDGFDLHGPGRDVVLAMIAWAAELELQAIRERLATARERAREKGVRWGRPPRMTAAEVKRAQELRAKGHSIRYVSRVLKVPRPTLSASLARVSRKPPLAGPRKAGPKRKS